MYCRCLAFCKSYIFISHKISAKWATRRNFGSIVYRFHGRQAAIVRVYIW